MMPGEDNRLLHDIEQGESWLRGLLARYPSPECRNLGALRARVRIAVLEPSLALGLPNGPSPATLARIKTAVRQELAGAAQAPPVRSLTHPAHPRLRRWGLLVGGLATAAALALVVRVGQNPAASPGAPEVAAYDLEDFVEVVTGNVSGFTTEGSTQSMVDSEHGDSTDAGGLSDDTWFQEEVEALDQEMDRLQSDRGLASDV